MPSLLVVVCQLQCQRVGKDQIPSPAGRGAMLFGWSLGIHAYVLGMSPVLPKAVIFFFLYYFFSLPSCNLGFLSLKISYIKLQRTPTLLIRDQGVCISFHLFNSPNACRHRTRWLLACAVPSLRHRTSIFMLSFWPTVFGCPISLHFNYA